MKVCEKRGWILEVDEQAGACLAWVSSPNIIAPGGAHGRVVAGYGKGTTIPDAVRMALAEAGHHWLASKMEDLDAIADLERHFFNGKELFV